MNSYYSGLYWTEEDNIDRKMVRNHLRVVGTAHVGQLVVDCWQKSGDLIGVPRYWARSQGLPGQDRTVCPRASWPAFRGKYRDNQPKALQEMLGALKQHQSYLLQAHTGFGKSLVGLSGVAALQTNVLVVAHKTDLLKQWRDSAKDFFGVESGLVQGDQWDWKHKVVVTTMQTLIKNLDKLPKGFKEHFGCLLIDEGHHMPCDTLTNIVSALPARYRIGMSATWNRTDNLGRVWELHFGKLGTKFKDVNQETKKYVHFLPVKLNLSDKSHYIKGKLSHSKYITSIGQSQELVWVLIDKIQAALDQGRRVLVVSHRTDQLKMFKIGLDSRGVKSIMYTGPSKTTKEQARQCRVILATAQKVSEGTDIPELDTLVMATPIGDITQVAGRITRKHKGKKSPLIIYPIIQTPYLIAISKKIVKQAAALDFKQIK